MVYQNGYYFSDPLPYSLRQQIQRVKVNKPSCILVDGPLGLGKTTFASHIINFINNEYNLPHLDLQKKYHPQLSLGGAEFTSHFKMCFKLKLPVLAYDEAGDFNKRGAIGRFNQMINRVFEIYRGFNIIIIIILPTFMLLDNNLFDNQIPRLLIHLKKRHITQVDYDVYSLSGMNWIRHWFDKLNKGNKIKCYSFVHPNFRGHFQNLEPDEAVKLANLTMKGKDDILDKTERRLKGLITYNDMITKLGRSGEWIRQHLTKLHIKPVTRQNRIHLFREDVINLLEGELIRK